MVKVCLVSVSAKNVHKSLAAWCLKAYCEQQSSSLSIDIVEGNVNEGMHSVLERVVSVIGKGLDVPCVVGFSCYIWNIEFVKRLGTLLRRLYSNIIIVLGGAEVVAEQNLSSFPFANCIVVGAGEQPFYSLLCKVEQGEPLPSVVRGNNTNFSSMPSPFTSQYFSSFAGNQISSISNQLLYYESIRGCPFSCSYCLSSIEQGVHCLNLDRVFAELQMLVDKGAGCVKFVDRTFNANADRAREILRFVGGLNTSCTFHFEVASELFDEETLQVIEGLPHGRVQFEIGVQSVSEAVLNAVSRKTNLEKSLSVIGRLSKMGNCHVHADLIAGLPHETLASFAEAVDRLYNAKPHMLQLGFLKMLKGSHIRELDFGAVYLDVAPYEVYQTDTLSCADMLRLKRIEEVIERFYNSRAFTQTVELGVESFASAFRFFNELSAYIRQNHLNVAMSLKNSYSALYSFLQGRVQEDRLCHAIKLDCLSFDPKGQLPSQIEGQRNKQLEQQLKGKFAKNVAYRVEYFALDNTHKLFVYSHKNVVQNRYAHTVL